MQTVRGSSKPNDSDRNDRATTAIHRALAAFEATSGLVPLVVLLPRRVFTQYVFEQSILADVLPDGPVAGDPREWADVRIVEHEALEEIEVY